VSGRPAGTVADDKATASYSDVESGEYHHQVTIDYSDHSYTSDPRIVDKGSALVPQPSNGRY
jgi:hypothetical protein